MSTPVLELRATESHDVTIVRAIDAQQILDRAEHAERPYAAWAKRPRRASRISFADMEEVTLTNIAGPTFEVGRMPKTGRERRPGERTRELEEMRDLASESRAHFATAAVALVILVLTCAAIARAGDADARERAHIAELSAG